ncbi:MAG: carbohydrate kinase family protein [Anaerolineales bacterium]|nr:carbohydrate kinase family protein [Anaerolineales bacterium]
MTAYDILVPGDYFCDVVFSGVPRMPTLGTEIYTQALTVTVGGALNTVFALKRLGLKVGWIARLGNDVFSRIIQEAVEREGIGTELVTRLDRPYQRVTVSLSFPEDRAFISYVDPEPGILDLARAVIDRVGFRHLHIGGLTTGPAACALFDAAHARGAAVSMDCQEHNVRLTDPRVVEALTRVDLFLPNAAEATRLTEADSVDSAGRLLQRVTPCVVIKDGASGAGLWRGGRAWHAPALPVTPIDTTGAGDVFNAGFLTAWMSGAEPAECLRWGNVCGGLSTQGHGGAASAPTRERVEGVLAGAAPPE